MEKILDKIENVVEKWLNDLEQNPIKASIRLFIFYWIAKTIWREVKR